MIYLDNAATSFPKPEAVYSRVDQVLREISGNPGRASHRMAIEASRVIFNSREAVARLIGATDSARVALTKNATEAVNIALKGLVSPGDHVVTTTFEHNAVAKTLAVLESSGLSVTRVGPTRAGLLEADAIERAFTGSTKMLCVSHASNVFGAIQDAAELGRICAKHKVLFMLDGAQTVGAVPVDVEAMKIDVLAGTGHKALLGPQGTGFLYVAPGVDPPPLVDGGTGELDTVLEMPDRLECGTMNTPGVGGLGAGVEFVLAEGVDAVRARESSLTAALLSGLSSIEGVSIIGGLDPGKRVALVSFNIDGVDPADVGVRLDSEFSILVRTGTHCAPDAHREAGTHPAGAVRVSPGYFTRDDEIEVFLGAISSIASGPKPGQG